MMKLPRFALALALALALGASHALASPYVVVNATQQCGGKGGNCQRWTEYMKDVVKKDTGFELSEQCADEQYKLAICNDGTKCTRQTEWFWMCTEVEADDEATAEVEVIAKYGQCGGKGSECKKYGDEACVDEQFPGFECATGSVCDRKDEYYWQCLPKSSRSAQKPSTSRHNHGSEEFMQLKTYDQCGGKTGPLCNGQVDCGDKYYDEVACPADAECVRKDEYYWQCKPASEAADEPKPVEVTELKLYDQCGGKTGPLCNGQASCGDLYYEEVVCPAEAQCVRKDEYYWQCLPKSSSRKASKTSTSSSRKASTSTSTRHHDDGHTLKMWEQCGGKTGPKCNGIHCADQPYSVLYCPADADCIRESEYYWQCRPKGGSSGHQHESSSSGGIAKWQQCGGKGGECGSATCVDGAFPGKSCQAGLNCVRHNEWYYQCM